MVNLVTFDTKRTMTVPSGGPVSMKAVRNYVFRLMPKVRGYLSTLDALAIASVLNGQTSASLSGGLAEIGVFFGRSFYLMAMLMNDSENALAMDLFNIGEAPGRDSEQFTCFLEVGRRMGIKLERDMAFIGNAQLLRPENILEKTGPVRFFSVDGGHALGEVQHDVNLAANTISNHGVICFDDFCNPEWPEVTLAVLDFLRATAADFTPFLISQKKLFVCKRQYSDFYNRLIESAPLLHNFKKAHVDLLGSRTLIVRSKPSEYLRYEAFARTGLGRLNMLFQ